MRERESKNWKKLNSEQEAESPCIQTWQRRGKRNRGGTTSKSGDFINNIFSKKIFF